MVVRTRVVGPEKVVGCGSGRVIFGFPALGGALKEWVLPDMTQRERDSKKNGKWGIRSVNGSGR